MKPVINDTFFRDLIWKAPWVVNREEYLMSTLCCMLEEYPDFLEDQKFLASFDNALLLFAAYCGRWDYDTNRRLIYNEPVKQLLLRYRSDGLDYVKSLIYNVKNGRLMHQVFPITSNPLNQELLEIILENDREAGPRRVLDHLVDGGIFKDPWRLQIAGDIDQVRHGAQTWDWFYQAHRDDCSTREPQFENMLLKKVWMIFETFKKEGYREPASQGPGKNGALRPPR